jgi:NhaA family Na+:H+ antiporter
MAGHRSPKAPGKPTPAERVLGPFTRFAELESSGGILLVACALIAMIWANSPWAEGYFELWHTYLGVFIGDKADPVFKMNMSLGHWINDGLMAIFFFLVGLEIKREVMVGELASFRKASLPLMAALGGVILPALIYFAFNPSGEAARGWGIPMATDIAFALGILALLGSRVPIGLKVFLTALAIADDIMAVLVIAVFYTTELQVNYLLGCGAVMFGLWLFSMIKLRSIVPYFLLGAILWYLMYKSGVHATIAGILVAMMIPAKPRIGAKAFTELTQDLIEVFSGEVDDDEPMPGAHRAVPELGARIEQVDTPLHRIERVLHPWVAFFIMPVFALANAGVAFGGSASGLGSPVVLGVSLGLVAGKFFGIWGFAWLSVKLNFASLPKGVNWQMLRGTAMLGGIGFTMSLFVANLAFGEDSFLGQSKIGILAGSLVAAVVGLLVLKSSLHKAQREEATSP